MALLVCVTTLNQWDGSGHSHFSIWMMWVPTGMDRVKHVALSSLVLTNGYISVAEGWVDGYTVLVDFLTRRPVRVGFFHPLYSMIHTDVVTCCRDIRLNTGLEDIRSLNSSN